jgi:hypothetical protein
VPSDGGGLDPGYDPGGFIASFACDPDLELTSDAGCSFRGVLAPVAARLLFRAVATTTRIIQADNSCGFSSLPVLAAPAQVMGAVGMPGLVEHRVNGCSFSRTPPASDQPLSIDCLRGATFAEGGATVTGRRVTSGLRVEQCMGACLQLAVPLTRTGVQLAFDAITPSAFEVREERPREAEAAPFAVLRGGTITATVNPILGQNATMTQLFDVATPVLGASFEATAVPMDLVIGARRFSITVDAAQLEAQNGAFMGAGNFVRGQITVDGLPLTLPQIPLDPAYDQADFDLSYDCTPNLLGVVPPN